jgi:hypothetical protein
MVDCVVCQYWSERIEETRIRGKNTLQEEARLIATLRRPQRGSCACRFPDLLRDLASRSWSDRIWLQFGIAVASVIAVVPNH